MSTVNKEGSQYINVDILRNLSVAGDRPWLIVALTIVGVTIFATTQMEELRTVLSVLLLGVVALVVAIAIMGIYRTPIDRKSGY